MRYSHHAGNGNEEITAYPSAVKKKSAHLLLCWRPSFGLFSPLHAAANALRYDSPLHFAANAFRNNIPHCPCSLQVESTCHRIDIQHFSSKIQTVMLAAFQCRGVYILQVHSSARDEFIFESVPSRYFERAVCHPCRHAVITLLPQFSPSGVVS